MLDAAVQGLAARSYNAIRGKLINELAVEIRRAQEDVASRGIVGGPLVGMALDLGAASIRSRYAAAGAELLHACRSRGLAYYDGLVCDLLEGFGTLVAAEPLQAEDQLKQALRILPNSTAVADSIRFVIHQTDADALALERAHFEHFSAELETESKKKAELSRNERIRIGIGVLTGGGGVAIIRWLSDNWQSIAVHFRSN